MLERVGREPVTLQRLSELRGAPADSTLRNLVAILQAKLEFSARLPVLIYEADQAGQHACAQMLRSLASMERVQIGALLDGLREHIELMDESAPASPSAG